MTSSIVVDKKIGELSTRPKVDTWAACAAVWAHVFVLATPGWLRWPRHRRPVGDALAAALEVATGAPVAAGELVTRIEEFDVEDDGSAEWQYTIDIISMLYTALTSDDHLGCATTTLTTYLEGTFNVIANDLATMDGRPISQLDAERRVAEDPRWHQAVAFVNAL